MGVERVTYEVSLDIDCAAWRKAMGSDATNAEIIRSVGSDLLHAHLALGTVNVFAVNTCVDITDTDRLRFLNKRFFGATDETVKTYKDGGLL